MTLKYPLLLLLFTIYIPLIWWYLAKHKSAEPSLSISSTRAFGNMPKSWKIYMLHARFVLRLLAIGAVIIALCRPQMHGDSSKSTVMGTDIVLALDISSSMETPDFTPNRFAVAKKTAVDFVNRRPNDNLGLVIFAGESMTLLPLTNDHRPIIAQIENLRTADLLHDGTALGNGLVSAVNRVSAGKSKSKSIILLTDGTDNMSDIDPKVAAEIAAKDSVRVYTIGVGTDGVINIANDPFGTSVTSMETSIDEETLQAIADISGGKFFRATDKKMLEDVFKEIDKLEKSRIEALHHDYREEAFMPFVLIAILLIFFEMFINYVIVRRIP